MAAASAGATVELMASTNLREDACSAAALIRACTASAPASLPDAEAAVYRERNSAPVEFIGSTMASAKSVKSLSPSIIACSTA